MDDLIMTLDSASADLQIAGGHQRNGNLEGMRNCIEASIRRIHDVMSYCERNGRIIPCQIEELADKAENLLNDLRDSEEMLSAFTNISSVDKGEIQ